VFIPRSDAGHQLELSQTSPALPFVPSSSINFPEVSDSSLNWQSTADSQANDRSNTNLTGGGLKWIVRGSQARVPSVSPRIGPLELSNPSFSAPPPTVTAGTTLAVNPRNSANSTGESVSGSIPARESSAAQESSAESRRSTLASFVSSRILAERPAVDDGGRIVAAIDNPPGWQAIGEELSQRIANCETLINRHAYFSAREEAESAMLHLVRLLDLMSNQYQSEPAWHAAQQAMLEAEDFANVQRLTSDSDFLRRIILSHQTPVLKDADVAALAPMAAAQHYRQFAEKKLIEASLGHPWASEIAYALGRTYQSQADATEDGLNQQLRWKAATFYRAALAVSPSNTVAANQLGYVFLQMDRPADARDALLTSIYSGPTLAAYENLVEASRRLGDSATSNWAWQQVTLAKSQLPAESGIPQFVEIDPRTFAAMSPYTIGPPPQQSTPGANSPFRTASMPHATQSMGSQPSTALPSNY